MTLMNQEMVYNSVGKKIKADLYEGNAVVLFAYGLSGSGKTFTVFGPDAVDIPEVSGARFGFGLGWLRFVVEARRCGALASLSWLCGM